MLRSLLLATAALCGPVTAQTEITGTVRTTWSSDGYTETLAGAVAYDFAGRDETGDHFRLRSADLQWAAAGTVHGDCSASGSAGLTVTDPDAGLIVLSSSSRWYAATGFAMDILAVARVAVACPEPRGSWEETPDNVQFLSVVPVISAAEYEIVGLTETRYLLQGRWTERTGGADVTYEWELWSDDVRASSGGDAPEQGAFALSGAYPNPTAGPARLTLAVPAAGHLAVGVYDVLGREVARLHDGPAAAGDLPLLLDGAALAPGRYVVRASGPAGVATHRSVTVVGTVVR